MAVVEVASRCEACGVWLLLRTLSLCLLTTALCLSREDRVREGRRGRWVGCSVRKCLTVVVQVQVERPTIVVVHLSGRHRSESTDFEEGSKVIQRYVVVVGACSSSKEGSQLSGCFHFHFHAPNWLAEWGKNRSWHTLDTASQVEPRDQRLGRWCSQTVAQSMCGACRMCWLFLAEWKNAGTKLEREPGEPLLASTSMGQKGVNRDPILLQLS